jgi:hypothetical protein
MTPPSPLLSALLLLNADAVLDLLADTVPVEDRIAVATALRDLPDDTVPAFVTEAAMLCLAAEPRVQGVLDTLAQRQEVRGGDPQAMTQLMDLWQMIRSDTGLAVLVALLLRLLASNRIKAGKFEYDGGSAFTQIAELISAIRGKNGK